MSAPPAAAKRLHASPKGSYGDVGIVGGAAGMTGAALLAGRAALAHGAGRVLVGFLAADAPTLDAQAPDLMVRQIKSGILDLIGAARPSIADPFIPKKIEEGRIDDGGIARGCDRVTGHLGRPMDFEVDPLLHALGDARRQLRPLFSRHGVHPHQPERFGAS